MLPLNGSSSIQPLPSADGVSNGVLKILLVDDEPNTVQLVRRILQADGHEVFEAFDGEQAIEMFHKHHPDLLLLDAVIPRIDGLTVLSEIRKQDKTTGVIMFSALTSELLVLQAMQGGADDFVNKPFTLKTLRMHIRRVIDKVHLRQQNALLQQQLVEANDKLRHYMAAPLADSIIANPFRPRLGGERQTITVLFIDICNFSSIVQSHSADDVLKFLNDYFAFASDAIVQNGGLVDKIFGDGFMALFNVPTQLPDHATAALRSAIEINRRSLVWNENRRLKFLPRFGIHTGEAIVGNIGSANHMNFTAIGDTVNLAKRLEEAADPGEIIVSDESFNLLDAPSLNLSVYYIEQLESVYLKGRQNPVSLHRISVEPREDSEST